jgi:ABC-type transporter Mla MlaB component
MVFACHFDQLFIFLIVQIALEKIDRVDMFALIQHFIMKVRPSGKTGIANIPDDLSSFYFLPD